MFDCLKRTPPTPPPQGFVTYFIDEVGRPAAMDSAGAVALILTEEPGDVFFANSIRQETQTLVAAATPDQVVQTIPIPTGTDKTVHVFGFLTVASANGGVRASHFSIAAARMSSGVLELPTGGAFSEGSPAGFSNDGPSFQDVIVDGGNLVIRFAGNGANGFVAMVTSTKVTDSLTPIPNMSAPE